MSAGSSTRPPRATLIRYAPGFMRASSSRPIMPSVAGTKGACSDTKSDSARRSGSGRQSIPAAAASARLTHGVGAEDPELEGASLRGQPPADPAETDDAERPAAQPAERPRSGAVVPRAGPERRPEGRQAARAREEETERVVGDLLGAVVRHVDHDHALPSRGADVGVVDAGAVEPEHPAAGEPSDEGGVDRRVLDEEGVARRGLAEARLGRERGAVDHVDPVRLQHRALRREVREHVGEHESSGSGALRHARRVSAMRSRSTPHGAGNGSSIRKLGVTVEKWTRGSE